MKNPELEKAKFLIQNTNSVFAYVSDSEEIVSDSKGIGFVASLCNENKDLSEGAVADKIVGKAVALLFVFMGVKCVYAEILSESGAKVFEKHKVEYSFGTKTQMIINRKGDGPCPMENAVKNTDSPEEALSAINRTLEELRK